MFIGVNVWGVLLTPTCMGGSNIFRRHRRRRRRRRSCWCQLQGGWGGGGKLRNASVTFLFFCMKFLWDDINNIS